MKRLLPLAFVTSLAAMAVTSGIKDHTNDVLNKLEQIPDSIYENIKQEDLLIDQVYQKLAQDGWSAGEIRAVMDNYLAVNKPRVRGTFAYAAYSKDWLSLYGLRNGRDTITELIDSTSAASGRAAVRAHALATGNDFDNYYDQVLYNRRAVGEARDPGFFRASLPTPSSGRVVWAVMDPKNPDHIMAHPDGCGIMRTDNMGQHWETITDRIPKRIHRNYIGHSAIPVDPDDWNHVFAFVSASPNVVYETFDGGQSWTQVEGATHYNFKRGYAYRDSIGTLKFIGAVQSGGTNNQVWLSSDKGVTWNQIVIPDSMKDVRDDGVKFTSFQEFAFHPTKRNLIYIPSSKQIFYFDDGGQVTKTGTTVTHNLKRLYFNVWDPDSTTLRCSGTTFPYPARSQSFLNINPNNPLEMWFACGSSAASNNSALFRSRDGGKNWITLNDPVSGYGSGSIFGNEAPGTWLGGFGVNYKNTNKVYGCVMSSAKSTDGGKTGTEYVWWNRCKSKVNGSWYYVSNAGHNADNHFIASHASGRVLRGSDAGMLMIDDSIASDWINIGGDMGQMLFYSLRCNEFGDQLMVGNTQDINVETYRYGRWGYQVGYEGSNVFVNPYSNETYWSAHGDGLSGLEYSSWYTTDSWADVYTGNWYVRQNNAYSTTQYLYIVKDFGRVAQQLNILTSDKSTTALVNQISISRSSPNNDASTVWLRTNGNFFRYSQDCFATCTDPYTIVGLGNVQSFAVDPDDWTKAYVVNRVTDPTVNKVTHYHNEVWYVDLVEKKMLTNLTYDLPKDIECHTFILHEGSGDLYFYNNAYGIYVLPKGSSSWKFWVRGYNPAKSSGITINYTTQEMVLRDYGRNIWVADLETPADRFFKNGFKLHEISNVDGRRTIGIDTKMVIPLYYNYTWTVNDKDVSCPYQFLTSKLNVGDRVRLKLTLRESPDVSTTSDEYTVTETTPVTIDHTPGRTLYSNGKGRVDLGYVDLFYKDFTIDMWIKPETATGVILSNGQCNQTRDRRGWWLGLDAGVLKFCYSPANWFVVPLYETSITQDATLSAGSLDLNQWSHIAVTQSQSGTICIYVNGVKKVEATRIRQDFTLNNALYLSLFADGYEESTLAATVDELKIHNYKMSDDDVRRAMYSLRSSNTDGLAYYNNFNAASLEGNSETYTLQPMQSRIMAETTSQASTLLTGADYAATGAVSTTAVDFTDNSQKLLTISRSTTSSSAINMAVYGYPRDLMTGNSANVSTDFYEIKPFGFVIKAFDTYGSTEKVNLTLPTETFAAKDQYKVFCASSTDSITYWKLLGQTSLNSDGKQMLSDVLLSDIDGKRIVVTCISHGIELLPEGSAITNEGYIEIYDNDTFVDFDAIVHGSTTEPSEGYYIVSSVDSVARVEDEIYFKSGSAKGQLHIDGTKLSRFGDEVTVTFSSKDNTLIPYTLKIVNRILPTDVSEALVMKQGAAIMGDPLKTSKLSGSKNVTFMTWVRVDNASALSGTKPLMMFRNSSQANGIYLQDGNFRFYWNNSYPFGSTASIHNIDASMVGRWVHLALVVDGTLGKYRLYMNGKEGLYSRTITGANITSELMLGLGTSTDTPWFEGAFDQTMVWNKALTAEEVLYYMQHIPSIKADGLVFYGNMDYYDANDNLKEVMSDATATLKGTVAKHQQSTILINPESAVTYTSTNTASANIWKIPIVSKVITSNRVAMFKKFSYNFLSDTIATLSPLNKQAYTVCWPSYDTGTASTSYSFVFYENSVKKGSELTLGIRPLGSTTPYSTFVKTTPTADGTATFTVPYTSMKTAIEMMVFTAAPDSILSVQMALPSNETRDLQKFILRDDESEIPVEVTLLDGVKSTNALIVIDQKEYASSDKETIDPTADNPKFTIKIDKTKINKTGWNNITARIMGTDCQPLNIRFSLTPKVRLYLEDGVTDRIVTTTTEALPVKVEWLQGAMDTPLEFDITTDLKSVLNSATGTLLTNSPKKITGLEFYNTSHEIEDGWNLLGNPYLSNINLTRAINYETDGTTNFVYHYSPKRRNFIVSERNNFDSNKNIYPFTPFFVQATSGSATFTVTPYARLTSLVKKLMAVDASTTENAVVLELYNEAGELEDETKIIFVNGAAYAVSVGEDAPKMWSLDSTADQIYSLYDGYALAVNSVPYRTGTIPIGIKAGTTGTKTIKVKSVTGKYAKLVGFDVVNKTSNELTPGTEYSFEETTLGEHNNQFEIRVEVTTTDVQDIADVPVKVTVVGDECIITGLHGNSDIRICDMAGRVMTSTNTHATEYRVQLGSGVYIVTVTEDEKDNITKIAVK